MSSKTTEHIPFAHLDPIKMCAQTIAHSALLLFQKRHYGKQSPNMPPRVKRAVCVPINASFLFSVLVAISHRKIWHVCSRQANLVKQNQRSQTNEAQERSVVSSAGSSSRETYLEQYFREMEAFSADCDDVFVSEHVGLNIVRTFRGRRQSGKVSLVEHTLILRQSIPLMTSCW